MGTYSHAVRLTAVAKADRGGGCLIFALGEKRQVHGSKLMGAADLSVSDADLDLLDAYLLSDQSPPECMLLSDLDGFLTGIAIGPELVMPSEWLPHVWGGEEPMFDDHVQASAILGTIMGRYNAIVREVEAGAFGPLFWKNADGTVIAADWAEGFLHAVALRADAWEPLMRSRGTGGCSFPSWPCARMSMVTRLSGLSLTRKTG
jgi:yecA family protein